MAAVLHSDSRAANGECRSRRFASFRGESLPLVTKLSRAVADGVRKRQASACLQTTSSIVPSWLLEAEVSAPEPGVGHVPRDAFLQDFDPAVRVLNRSGIVVALEELRSSRDEIDRFFVSVPSRRRLIPTEQRTAGWPIALAVIRNEPVGAKGQPAVETAGTPRTSHGLACRPASRRRIAPASASCRFRLGGRLKVGPCTGVRRGTRARIRWRSSSLAVCYCTGDRCQSESSGDEEDPP